MPKQMYVVANGNILKINPLRSIIKDDLKDSDETKVVIKHNPSQKHACVDIVIDARGKEKLSNTERLKLMKKIITDETITNIPTLNSQYTMYLDSKVIDELGKVKQSAIINKESILYDAIVPMPINEKDELNYVHNIVFTGGFKIDIPESTGFGITSFMRGKETIFTINDISIVGDSAPEDQATRYDYYHKRDIVKKYHDVPEHCKEIHHSPWINDMRYLDPYMLLPCEFFRRHIPDYGIIERTVSKRAVEIKEKLLKEAAEKMDESHITLLSTAVSNVDINLGELPKTGLTSIDINITVIMDSAIEVYDDVDINDMLADNYDILYPPFLDKSEDSITDQPKEDEEDTMTDTE